MTTPSLPPYIISLSNNEWYLLVRVQPGAKKSEYMGEMDGRLRIRIAAPAVDNKANKLLIAFIAKSIGLRPSNITVLSGETSRLKKLHITAKKLPNWSCLT